MKPVKHPQSYRLICWLCVMYKIFERLSYTPINTIINPSLPWEQVRFYREKLTVHHAALLTQDIEDSFTARRKAGAVFVNLTAAYDTVWHRGLTCKLLRLLPDKHMVRMIMELVQNRNFTLTIGDNKRSSYDTLRAASPGICLGSPPF